MSSPKSKKVHYEQGTKGSKSHHRHHSRDSGVGSSSASDRASLGTAPDTYNYSPSAADAQQYNLRVVQEALSAAYEKISQLESKNASLNDSLSESNKLNRALKKEKSGLIKENEDLFDAIEDLNRRLKRESPPRSPTSSSAVKSERRQSSSSKKGSESPRPTLVYADERPSSKHVNRRASVYDQAPPLVPQAPMNTHPNPFAPRTSPQVTYASIPTTLAYAPSSISYSTAPLYAISSSHSSRSHSKYDDGKYHLQPL